MPVGTLYTLTKKLRKVKELEEYEENDHAKNGGSTITQAANRPPAGIRQAAKAYGAATGLASVPGLD